MNTVERVARAIVERDEWDDYSPALQDACRKMARRAIAAMREPSEAMLSAADAYVHQENVWRRMIDAALTEGGDV
jgi:hypothetical protein